MADQEQTPPEPSRSEDSPDQGSVFGNLPGTRPGVRSPRRGEAAAAGARAKPAGRQPGSASRPKASVARSPRHGSDRPEADSPETEHQAPPRAGAEHGGVEDRGGVEDLAWAGIAVAAEAATLGVRLLSRAMGAVRKPSDRG
jgi:hypothetical protein